jgi:uncharacterized protein
VAAEFFVDTSAWYPLLVASHADHAPLAGALRVLVGKRRRLVTTNLVVAETHALLLRRVGRKPALTFADTVRQSPNLVVTSTAELEESAVREWLAEYEDHDFSLADAVSFSVMRARKITDVLSLDHHFAVAGFTVVGERS